MTTLPMDRAAFVKVWPKFRAWLGENGADILAPTNPYEIARFTTNEGTGVVYINRSGRISAWEGGASTAFLAWKGGAQWRARQKTVRRRNTARPTILALIERDGPCCIYCRTELTVDTATVEHIVPVTAGGPDSVINKALACEPCNVAGGALSPVEKMRKVAR
jgi:hypothetical protein